MLRQEIEELIKEAIRQAQQEKLLAEFEAPEILVERTSDEGFGDYSSSIALKIARQAGKPPMETAEIIAQEARDICDEPTCIVERIEVVKPGFLNFFVSRPHLVKKISTILEQKENFGSFDFGKGKKVQVEFISANPTGPLTLGNGRGGFMGDTLSNVLKRAGFNVQREYYINDAGFQINKLGHSVFGDEQAVYRGKYIEELRSRLIKSPPPPPFQRGEEDAEQVGKQAAKIILEETIKPVVENKMKIRFDKWFFESELYPEKVENILSFLKEKDLIYEKEGALWFSSTKFGDDKDRVVIKADGEKTYLASDLAYLKDKFGRGLERIIYFWGADHHGYVSRLKAAAQALGYRAEQLDMVILQLVHLTKGGQEVKMSKRAGIYVTLDELLDEIPLDVARFFFLMYSADTHMDFNLDLAKEQSEKNPVYYVQYAYARIHSILAKSEIRNPKSETNSKSQIQNSKIELLKETAEMALIKQLIRLSEIIEDTAGDYQVQRLPQYALELVRAFHKFYEECRVIDAKNPELTQARLALVEATRIVLKNTLDLMGISAPESM